MVVVSRKMQAVCLALLCCQPRAVSLSVVTWHLRDLFKSIFIGFCANSIFTPIKSFPECADNKRILGRFSLKSLETARNEARTS